MNFDEMNSAVQDAERTIRIANTTTSKLLKMLVGRLRTVDNNYQSRKALAALKKELSQYNVKSGTWKS